jgi:hypothetical protein
VSYYGPNNIAKLPKGYSAWSANPNWTRWNTTNNKNISATTSALNTLNTRTTDRDKKQNQFDDAAKELRTQSKAEKAFKKSTGFGFGSGGGGRAGGKGGVAKAGTKSGKGKGKKGKKGDKDKKDESLFKILGRDLIKELNDIEKYK